MGKARGSDLVINQLNEQHKKFIAEYIKDYNAKRAYKAVYDKNGKMPDATAEASGSRLLRHVKVRQEIDALTKKVVDKCIVKKETVLKELLRIATSDIRKAYDIDGKLNDIKDMPDDIAHCISGIEVDEKFDSQYDENEQAVIKKKYYTKKLKLWDKNKALENLARHLKLLTDKLEVETKEPLFDRIKAARERARNRDKKDE